MINHSNILKMQSFIEERYFYFYFYFFPFFSLFFLVEKHINLVYKSLDVVVMIMSHLHFLN